MKRLLFAAVMILMSGIAASAGTKPVSLAPVPYQLLLPEEIVTHLSVKALTSPWAEEAAKAGVSAAAAVYYTPDEGPVTILMTVYHFPEAKFDAAQNPDEPPPFGQAVIRKDGMVLSVAGPHDTIYEPETQDGKNVVAASMVIYEPQTYAPVE